MVRIRSYTFREIRTARYSESVYTYPLARAPDHAFAPMSYYTTRTRDMHHRTGHGLIFLLIKNIPPTS